MEPDVLRPGPVIGTGQRVLTLQSATLANRLSGYASVASALFRNLANPGVDPSRLTSQRARTRQLASLIREIEHADEQHLYETSELIPRRLWATIRKSLEIPADLDEVLTTLLDQVDAGQIDRAVMAEQGRTLLKLAQRLQETGRAELHSALEDLGERESPAGV
jgi:hypothetical protein